MPKEAYLSNDFKAEFAFLLTLMKVTYGTTNSLNYSKTLYEWTLGALITEGKIGKTYKPDGSFDKFVNVEKYKEKGFAESYNSVRRIYLEGLDCVAILASPGRKEYAQQQILKGCFAIDEAIFPIALSEGYLELKDMVKSITDTMNGLNQQRPE